MDVASRQRIEKRIVRLILRHGIALGYSFTVDNGEEIAPEQPSANERELMKLCFQTDEENLIVYKEGVRVGFVFLVYGNSGFDTVNDYAIRIEPILKLADEYADKCETRYFVR